jgi:two-component system, OmpR family, sensor histidine kinase KdpD
VTQDKVDTFLQLIRRARHGHLKIYLGYCAGVGKTYRMLEEGHRIKKEGIDVVVGLAETHGRPDTESLLAGLEVIPRLRHDYRGIAVEEMNLGAIIARKPQVALVDELAHTNVPGSANAKRYQDVQDILAAGIHVITTLNIQHLESLLDTVEKSVGVKVRERLPDSILAEADEIVNVDVSTEDLRERLHEGKVYTPERIEVALDHFFKTSNLEKLRELTLRELASQIDLRRRDVPPAGGESTPDQVMVCLSSRGPNSDSLLRYGSRLAGKLNRNWYAVYVQTPSENPLAVDLGVQTSISDTLTLAKQLGAMVFTYKGDDVAETILRFAREYRVGNVVIGKPSVPSRWKRGLGKKSIVDCLMEKSRNIALVVLDTRPKEEPPEPKPKAGAAARRGEGKTEAPIRPYSLEGMISPGRIAIWDRPVEKGEVLRRLTEDACRELGRDDAGPVLEAVLIRERQGSTFFNEGAAFPHVRIEGLRSPVVAIGLPRWGITDLHAENPIQIVFLILSPESMPDAQIRALAATSRAAKDRHLLMHLHAANTPGEVLAEIKLWEETSGAGN